MAEQKETYHWDQLVALIEEAKANPDLRTTLNTGTPAEVVTALQEQGITLDDLGKIFADLEVIADRSSIRYWSPL